MFFEMTVLRKGTEGYGSLRKATEGKKSFLKGFSRDKMSKLARESNRIELSQGQSNLVKP